MRKEQLVEVLDKLAKRRSAFHSEADFQHELAWELRGARLVDQVRLEWPFIADGRRQYLDLLCRVEGRWVGLELKYMTRREVLTVGDEVFTLRNQGAQDTRRYDFWRDVSRIEGLVASGEIARGFVVALTNDSSYWRRSDRETCDAAFRLHEGRSVGRGERAWRNGTGGGTMRGRERPLGVAGGHSIRWRRYSAPGENEGFRYLLLAAEQACIREVDVRGTL